MVVKTLDRSTLWDVQTPQIMKPELLRKGFEHVAANKLAVTDDVSIIEALGLPVKMTMGDYTNIKVRLSKDQGGKRGALSLTSSLYSRSPSLALGSGSGVRVRHRESGIIYIYVYVYVYVCVCVYDSRSVHGDLNLVVQVTTPEDMAVAEGFIADTAKALA